MTETLLNLLTRLSEAGADAVLSGSAAEPFYGPAFDRLLRKRVLVEQAPISDWDVCDGCECGLPSRPIRVAGDAFRAECPLDRREDIDLTEDDLRVFRIGAAALASAIGAAAEFGATPRAVTDKVWRLGDTPSGRAIFLALETAALTNETIVAAIRQGARSDAVTILAPKLPPALSRRFLDAGFHLVATLALLKTAPTGPGVTLDVAALDPTPLVPVLRVRTAAAEVQWDGRSVILSRQIFPVFERLLDKALSRDQVASGPYLEDTTGREAKDLIRELRDAFKAAGFTDAESKSMIATVRNRGYRLGVPVSGIMVDG